MHDHPARQALGHTAVTDRYVAITTVAQYVLLGAYLLGSWGLLLLAAGRVGDWGAVVDPGLERLGDPKDQIPPLGPDSTWNPLFWLLHLCRVVAVFGNPLLLVAVCAGALAVAFGWADRHSGGRRGRLVTVTAGTLLCVALLGVNQSPYGAALQSWLLD